MSFSDARIRSEIQQLKRELGKAKERERQTRQGCLDLVDAMREIVAGRENSTPTDAATAKELVDQAGILLAPNAE